MLKKIKVVIFLFLLSIELFCKINYYDLGFSALISSNYGVSEEMFKKSFLLEEDKSDESLFLLGNTYFLDKNYAEAKKCYEELLKNNNSQFYKIAKFMYAESCVYTNDFDNAEKIYSSIDLKQIEYLEPYILYGKIYSLYRLGKYSSVLTNISFFNSKIKENKFYVNKDVEEQILYFLAESWYKKGSLKNAQREFNKFLSLYKESEYLPYVNLRLSQIFSEQKQYSNAENFLKELSFEKFKGNSELVIKYNLSKILIKQKKYDLAQNVCHQILNNGFSDNLSDYVRLDLGYIFFEQKKYNSAINVLSKIKSKDSKIMMNTEYILSLSYFCLKEYDKSSKLLSYFVERYGRKSNLYDDACYWLGLSYMNAQKYQESINVLKGLVEKKSSIYANPSEFFIAKCYIYMKEFELAKNIFSRLLDKTKNEEIIANILYELGECYKLTSEYSIAEQYFEKLVSRTDEKGLDAKLSLADVYLRSKRYDEAEKIVLDIINSKKNDSKISHAKLLLFIVKYNRKEYNVALNIADEILRTDFSRQEKYFLIKSLSNIHIKNYNYDEALKYLKTLVELSNNLDDKFFAEIQMFNLICAKNDTKNIIQKILDLEKIYSESKYRTYLYSKAIRYFSLKNDSQKVMEYFVKIKNDENTLRLLSREDIFELINIALKYDFNRGLYLAELVPKLSQLDRREVIDILTKVGKLCLENKNYIAGLKFAAMIKQVSTDTDSLFFSEYLIGKIYESMGKYSDASNIYKSIIEKYNDSKHISKIYVSMIRLQMKLNNYDNVNKFENILLTLYPDAEDTYEYLFETAQKFELEKNYEEAIKRYSSVINSKDIERQSMSQKSLADCYYNLGRYKEASVEYLKMVYMYPQYKNLCAEAQYMVGVCCEKLKLTDEAKKAYNSSRQNFPGTLWAQEAEQRLKILK